MDKKYLVSCDYWNAFFGKVIIYKCEGIGELIKNIKKEPIQTFEEYFSPNDLEGRINDDNKSIVKTLNGIVHKLNKNKDEKNFKLLINQIHHILYNKGQNYYFK